MDFNWILNTPLWIQVIQKMSVPLIGMSNVLQVRLGIVSQTSLICRHRVPPSLYPQWKLTLGVLGLKTVREEGQLSVTTCELTGCVHLGQINCQSSLAACRLSVEMIPTQLPWNQSLHWSQQIMRCPVGGTDKTEMDPYNLTSQMKLHPDYIADKPEV